MPKAEGVHSTRAPARAPFRSVVPNSSVYLEPSPASADGSHMIGKLPSAVDLAELRGLSHPESPVRAIRAKCIDCCGGDASEARKCVYVGCPLWRESAARASATRMARADVRQRSARGFSSEQGDPATDPYPNVDCARTSKMEDRS